MSDRPSDDEMQRRIAALLMTQDAGKAVARRLEGRTEDMTTHPAAADLREQRLEAVCRRGLGRFETMAASASAAWDAGRSHGQKHRLH
jgi:hypothetical protein